MYSLENIVANWVLITPTLFNIIRQKNFHNFNMHIEEDITIMVLFHFNCQSILRENVKESDVY